MKRGCTVFDNYLAGLLPVTGAGVALDARHRHRHRHRLLVVGLLVLLFARADTRPDYPMSAMPRVHTHITTQNVVHATRL